jgi:hypothetical protein
LARGFLLGVLLGVVAAEVDADVTGSGHSKTTASIHGRHVNGIEAKFLRAEVQGEGGLDVAHIE